MEPKDPLTERIIACCYKVHTELGPGFPEKIYHNALKHAFEDDGLPYETERRFTVLYLGKRVGHLIVDLVVEGKVIVEIKAVTGMIPNIFSSQVLSYLRAAHLRVGLLINFGNKSCQVKRLVV